MKKIGLLFLLFLVFTKVQSQTEILNDNGSWLTFVNKITLSENFYVVNVVQQRRVRFLKETQGLIISPSINYKVSKNLSVGAGYLSYKFFPNGVSHSSIHKQENRFFQQINLTSKTGKFKISNRLRFEERVIELVNTNVTPNIIEGDKYVNRLRYRIQATTNLFKLKNNNYLMGKLSNEIRIRFADGITEPDFDQNNFEALIGYKLAHNSTIWTGYGRYYFRKNSSKYISNNIMHITLNYNLDFSKKN